MPVNFTPYIPQATDLLSPAMNMVKMQQSQEQMGLLRDYRQMQMQQMQVEQQKAEQQAQKQSFDEWLTIYDKISPEAAQVYAKNNPKSMTAFQGLDESVLYSNDFQNDLATSTKRVHKLKEVSRDPRTIQEVTTNEYNNLMSKYGGKDKYKEALSQFGKGIPTEEQVLKGEAGNIAESLSMLPEEAKAQYEPLLKPQLMGKSSEIYKQMYPAETPKEYAPELKKFVKGKQVRDVDMNKPLDVAKARAEGFAEYVEPDRGRETAGEAAAKAAARTTAGLKAWKSTFKDMMGREPSKEEIRKKLINDPYGLLEPIGEETPQSVSTPPLSTLKEGTKTTYKDGSEWTLRNGKPVKLK